MKIFLLISLALLLSISSYQDFKYRGISWYLFPLTLICITSLNLMEIEKMTLLKNTSLNMGFLALQLAFLGIYFTIKKVSFRDFFKQYMGLGDILFFIVLAVGLGFPLFPVFLILSLIFSLILGAMFFKKSTVPLAGIQALLLLVFIVFKELEVFSLPFKSFIL